MIFLSGGNKREHILQNFGPMTELSASIYPKKHLRPRSIPGGRCRFRQQATLFSCIFLYYTNDFIGFLPAFCLCENEKSPGGKLLHCRLYFLRFQKQHKALPFFLDLFELVHKGKGRRLSHNTGPLDHPQFFNGEQGIQMPDLFHAVEMV